MTRSEIHELGRRYPRVIRWSDEDGCYIGSLPDVCGDCTHGDTPEEVAANLEECAELYVENTLAEGLPLAEPGAVLVRPTRFRTGNVGSKIRLLRELHGMSQKTLAEMLGISLSTLTKWENGLRRPSRAAAKLLDILDKHPECIHS